MNAQNSIMTNNVIVIDYYDADDLRDKITCETDAGNLTWTVCQEMFSKLMPYVETEGPHGLVTQDISKMVDGVTMSIATVFGKKKGRRAMSTLTIEPELDDERDLVVVRDDDHSPVVMQPPTPIQSPKSATNQTELVILARSHKPARGGCLFMRCISCPTMAMYEFDSGKIPAMNGGISYRNVGVLTSCSVHERYIMSNNSKKSLDVSTCTKGFETLCVDPNLVKDPQGVKAMELIAGESVDWMKHTNGLVYLTRDKIRSFIGPGEKWTFPGPPSNAEPGCCSRTYSRISSRTSPFRMYSTRPAPRKI